MNFGTDPHLNSKNSDDSSIMGRNESYIEEGVWEKKLTGCFWRRIVLIAG